MKAEEIRVPAGYVIAIPENYSKNVQRMCVSSQLLSQIIENEYTWKDSIGLFDESVDLENEGDLSSDFIRERYYFVRSEFTMSENSLRAKHSELLHEIFGDEGKGVNDKWGKRRWWR